MRAIRSILFHAAVLACAGCWMSNGVLELHNNTGKTIKVYYSHPNKPPHHFTIMTEDGMGYSRTNLTADLPNWVFDAKATLYPGDILAIKNCPSYIKVVYEGEQESFCYRIPPMITRDDMKKTFDGNSKSRPEWFERHTYGGVFWDMRMPVLLESDGNMYYLSPPPKNSPDKEYLMSLLAKPEKISLEPDALAKENLKLSPFAFEPMRLYNY